MRLSKFWDEDVGKGHKHFVDSMYAHKKEHLIKQFRNNLLNYVNRDKVKSILDWGCGGGLLAKEMVKEFDLIIADIATSSLSACKKFIGKDHIKKEILIPDNLNSFNFDFNVDAIHCSNVIHHFPNMRYFEDVVGVWKKINPKMLLFNVKLGKTIDIKNYYKDKNYVSSLFVTKEVILDLFNDYILINFTTNKTLNNKVTVGSFVFERG